MRSYLELNKYLNTKKMSEDYQKIMQQTVFFDKILFDDAVQFYNEYFNYKSNPISQQEALMYAELGVRLNADLWKSLMPMTEEKMNSFYENTPFYFFHDIVRMMDGMHRDILSEMAKDRASEERILDFAGGIGAISIMFASIGKDITFYDSNKIQSSWVKWISKKRGLNIRVATKLSEIEGLFSYIIAKDVIEHVINPGELIEFFQSHLSPGGRYTITQIPCCGPEELAPMHFKIDGDMNCFSYDPELNKKTLAGIT